MTLKQKVEALLTVETLERSERQVFQFILDTNQDGELEGMMFPDNEAHVEGRFEWFFTPDGTRRTKAA